MDGGRLRVQGWGFMVCSWRAREAGNNFGNVASISKLFACNFNMRSRMPGQASQSVSQAQSQWVMGCPLRTPGSGLRSPYSGSRSLEHIPSTTDNDCGLRSVVGRSGRRELHANMPKWLFSSFIAAADSEKLQQLLLPAGYFGEEVRAWASWDV